MDYFRYIEVSIAEWCDERKRLLEHEGIVELLFRPFLRWLDKNLQEIVTEGLRQVSWYKTFWCLLLGIMD